MISIPFFQKTSKQPNKFLTLTIGTEEVKCVVFYKDPEEEKLKIIGSGKRVLPKGSVRSGIIIEDDDVEIATGEAIRAATENLEDEVRDVIISAENPTVLGITTTARYKRKDHAATISEKEVKSFYDYVSDAAYIEAQNEYLATTGNPDEPLEIITTSDVYLKIDGHSVGDAEGNEGKIIEGAVFHAFCPEFHIKSLQNISKKLGLKIIAIGSEMYCTAQWIKKILPETLDYILLDVAEDTTSVAVVFGGGIVSTKFLSMGHKHFVKQISEKMGVTIEESERLLLSFIENKLAAPEMEVVAGCIKEAAKIWLSGIEILFGEFTGVKTFPSKIFLQGKGTEIPEIVRAVTSDSWTKNIPFRDERAVSLLELDGLSVTDSTGQVKGKEWFNNVILSIIYSEIFGG